ncbi:hypothetical protein [Polaribacter glomeratus]|uniref:Lipoprotein n=1 Tax=Polaribacter glomeratus TaxID=102 RepID=A0A2S7WFY3_9FLAO|nr:hypothetical protein [Polaribacter glomeratus]PQJ76514.1 hypothetical protein BTO16_11455 [Polaribacter glomeratus]TXD64188.1 hypothetical protein ESX12_15870 [Polaribacter glomeratus]
MKQILYVLLALIVTSCASIPKESVNLMEVVIIQNQKAYDLNVVLINKLYKAKKEDVDIFIDGDYTSEIWKQFKALIPAGVDIQSNMSSIIPSLSKQINVQRNEMKSVLETARLETQEIILKDFKIQSEASKEVKNLLISASKVNENRLQILQDYSNRFKLGLDINELELSIDGFLNSAGNAGADIEKLGQEFLTKLNQLKKK